VDSPAEIGKKVKRSFRIVAILNLKIKNLTFVGLFIVETRIKEIHLQPI
jgi:hypothetical protein